MAAFHLVTDLDGTWLPETGQLSHLRQLEASLFAEPGVVLSFATGRTFASALDAIERWALRPPHHLISDVGTTLHHRTHAGSWVEDRAWTDRVASCWDSGAAQALVDSGLPAGLLLQPGVAPSRRLALQRAGNADMAEMTWRLRQACDAHGLVADVLPSHDLYFDVLPSGIHKGAALTYLQEVWKLPRPVVACGDSANDLGLFEASDQPVLMADGLGDEEAPPALVRRVRRTLHPGPEGIHEVLIALGLLEEASHAH